MTRDTLATLVTALTPLLLALVGAAATWAAAAVRRYTTSAQITAAVEALTRGAEAVVADLAQHVVADLKDPAKPGDWTEVTQAALRARAVERLRRILPEQSAALDRAHGHDSTTALLGALVERAVVRGKAGAS